MPKTAAQRNRVGRGAGPCHISGNSCYVTRKKRLELCRTFQKPQGFILGIFEFHRGLNTQDLDLHMNLSKPLNMVDFIHVIHIPLCLSMPTLFFALVFDLFIQVR